MTLKTYFASSPWQGASLGRSKAYHNSGPLADRALADSLLDSIVKQPRGVMQARARARILCGAGYAVVPSPPSPPIEGGWRAKWRNHCSFSAVLPLESTGASRRAIAASSFRRRPRFSLTSATRGPSVSQAPGRQPVVAAGRSPGAARVRAVRKSSTPAGAAPCPTIKTPLDDAPHVEQDGRTIFNDRIKVKR